MLASRHVIIALGLSTFWFSTATAEPVSSTVFGNLGASGTTGALSTTNTGITALDRAAQVFTTGTADNRQLQSITLGAFSTSGATVGLSIFNDAGGAPGSLFAQSTNTITLGTNTNGSLNTWLFGGAAMSPSATYWIVPAVDLNWSFRSNFAAPAVQNASGYSYAGMYQSANGGTSWTTEGGGGYAVSVQAVPEPSTYAMAAAAMSVLGWLRWRRQGDEPRR